MIDKEKMFIKWADKIDLATTIISKNFRDFGWTWNEQEPPNFNKIHQIIEKLVDDVLDMATEQVEPSPYRISSGRISVDLWEDEDESWQLEIKLDVT
jgi:hypothetical protein